MTTKNKSNSDYRIIGAGIFVPLFEKKNERATYKEFLCKLKECPVLAKGECIQVSPFRRCPYGKTRVEQSKTKRAQSYSPWMAKRKEQVAKLEAEGMTCPVYATDSLEFIGNYVWLPFKFINMNDQIPFLSKSVFGMEGSPFIKQEDFTIENILKIVNLQPRALFGKTIHEYQDKIVPHLLRSIRSKASELYRELVEKEPAVEKRIKPLSSITVPISLIPIGITEGYKASGKYLVKAWDGEKVTVYGDISIISLDHKRGDVECTIRPNSRMTVTVTDPRLVQSLADRYPEYAKG
jgi:hypothetical protein